MESGSENCDVGILKCVYITVFHFTCQETVLHWICSTEVPFDLPSQSVTLIINYISIYKYSCMHIINMAIHVIRMCTYITIKCVKIEYMHLIS